jgi:hypothetical protein
MKYYKTKVKVRSGGNGVFNFFIVEDLTDRYKMFVLEKLSCEWFNNIEIGQTLEAILCSDGKVLSVIGRVEENNDEREYNIKKSKE